MSAAASAVRSTRIPRLTLAAHLSRQLARPVKWVEDRQEHFLCTSHGRGEVQYVGRRLPARWDPERLRLRYYTDLGAYCNGRVPRRGGHAHALWRHGCLPGQTWPGPPTVIYTNKVPVGPCTGYGQHATAYVIERVMELDFAHD